MHDRHHHDIAPNKLEQDERSVTKWLNTMEASLARPDHKFSMAEFKPAEIRAINSYMATHENSLGRYEQFLPPIKIHGHSDKSHGHSDVDQRLAHKNNPASERDRVAAERTGPAPERNRVASERTSPAPERSRVASERTNVPPARRGNVEQDERAVTKWLNTMEASLASPDHKFSMDKFSKQEVQAINSYIATHQKSLGRYEQFLPQGQANKKADKNFFSQSERPHWV
ncbi:MAG: hypothetical protein IPI39_21435 [Candidatus Obscuribacter sp.]|nr:hypothetical protein [Candidatus Obscuribacter sp.]